MRSISPRRNGGSAIEATIARRSGHGFRSALQLLAQVLPESETRTPVVEEEGGSLTPVFNLLDSFVRDNAFWID